MMKNKENPDKKHKIESNGVGAEKVPDLIHLSLDSLVGPAVEIRRNIEEQLPKDFIGNIARYGILEPVIVRRIPRMNKYEVVAGNRRVAAARKAGLKEVPCIVRELDDLQSWTLGTNENLHRKDSSAVEVIESIMRNKELRSLSHRQIAEQIDKDESTVGNWFRVYNEEYLRKKIKIGDITVDAAVELLKSRPEADAPAEERRRWKALVDQSSRKSSYRLRKERQATKAKRIELKCRACGKSAKNCELRRLCPKCLADLSQMRKQKAI